MYAQEWFSVIMTYVIIILLHDPTESWPGPARLLVDQTERLRYQLIGQR